MFEANHEVALPAGFVHALAQSNSQNSILEATATWLPTIIAAERCTLALPHGRNHLQIFRLANAAQRDGHSPLRIDGSIVGRAFSSGSITNVPELRGVGTDDEERLIEAGMRSALVCPMISGGRAVGTINLANAEPNHYGPGDETLLTSIADLVGSFLRVHQLAESQRTLARTDPLTGFLNRRAILERLTYCLAHDDQLPSLLFLDIDSFKVLNDAHGHLHGDEVLRSLSKRIIGVIDESDLLGRIGGDEFLVIVRRDRTGATAAVAAERIRGVCSMPIAVRSVRSKVQVSIGIASPQSANSSAAELLQDADRAMYMAKGRDQGIAVADDELRSHWAMIEAVDRDLDSGMRSGSITFHYQPIRYLGSRRLRGAEALIRWNHPKIGSIPAPLLIDRIEATGRSEAFTRWSLGTIVEHWARVRQEVPPGAVETVAINLTPGQLSWDRYVDFHLRTIEHYGFQPEDIVVEVVESAEISPGGVAEKTLQRLCDARVKVALDDFGTGHNAFAYFTMFQIHAIKFDRSLVGVMGENELANQLLTGLSAMTSDLGVVSLAEGIETEAEAQLCEAANIDLGQGWHFGRPMMLEAFIELARSESLDTAFSKKIF